MKYRDSKGRFVKGCKFPQENRFRENGVEEWIAERTRIFNNEGWEIIFFDETQVNEDLIKIKLGD